MKRFLSFVVFLLGITAYAGGAGAHEVWLAPETYRLEEGATLKADLLNGQGFMGGALSYDANDFQRFEIWRDGAMRPVKGRLGDLPAARVPELAAGLHILVYQSMPEELRYVAWEKFVAFVEHKDAAWVLERHAARGLPREFDEVYTRFAKSLLGVGAATGKDRAFGLETEIVALANPYTAALTEMPVRVLYRDAPRPDAQVELFARAPDGTVVITRHRTDPNGEARLPVMPGYRYLVDAVVLREPSAELVAKTDAAWESLWASLTFEIPDAAPGR